MTAPITITTAEEWRPVTGYEGLYEVSSLGRVRRTAPTRAGRSHPGRIITANPSARNRHRQVALHRNGTCKVTRVHQLVAAAFLGPCPPGHVVAFRNNDPTDVAAANLVYRTRWQVNVRATAVLRKLSAAQAAEIRAAATQTPRVPLRTLAARYGITHQTVSKIQRGEAYPDLDNFDATAASPSSHNRSDGSAALLAGAPSRPGRPGIAHIAAGDTSNPVAGCSRVPLERATLTPAGAVAQQARCRRHGCQQRWPSAEHAGDSEAVSEILDVVRGDAA